MRIEAADLAGRGRLLRCCARPPFALERRRELDPEHLVYDPPKPGPGGSGPQLGETTDTEHEPTPDPALPPTPAFEFDQRLSW